MYCVTDSIFPSNVLSRLYFIAVNLYILSLMSKNIAEIFMNIFIYFFFKYLLEETKHTSDANIMAV